MRFRFLIIPVVFLLVTSCSEYEKLLKSTDFDLKKTRALEYYNEGKYVKTTELLRQVLPRYRATEEGEELNWINAQSYYGMKDYIMAGTQFKMFVDQFPFGKHAEEAHYLAAYCDYLNSPRPELDQENTKNAIEGFNIFINKFPHSPKVDECRTLLKEMEERLVEKNYRSARLYYDMKEYKSAVVAINNSLKNYANSKYREEMMFLKLNSLYLYAFYSMADKQKSRYQDTLDDYYSFMEEYPESKYSKDVKSIYQKTDKYLKSAIPVDQLNKQ
ncbi:MAG TPA: outer membrane protein assembly factor BamD [Bacteroidales bacterium]|nr:outer membrane protein assembly factor BamD [Bacteroidales bacterium]